MLWMLIMWLTANGFNRTTMGFVVLSNAFFVWFVASKVFWAVNVSTLKLCWFSVVTLTAVTSCTAHSVQGRTFQVFAVVQRIIFVVTFCVVTCWKIRTLVASSKKIIVCIKLRLVSNKTKLIFHGRSEDLMAREFETTFQKLISQSSISFTSRSRVFRHLITC